MSGRRSRRARRAAVAQAGHAIRLAGLAAEQADQALEFSVAVLNQVIAGESIARDDARRWIVVLEDAQRALRRIVPTLTGTA